MKKYVGEKIDENYWSVKNYWRNRWFLFLVLSLLAVLGGFPWNDIGNIKYSSLGVAVGLFFSIWLFWFAGIKLSNSDIKANRHKENRHSRWRKIIYRARKIIYHVRKIIYYVGYYSPLFLSACVLIIYRLEHDNFPAYPILWGIVFSVDLGFVMYRWTYRVLPNIFLAAAAFIFYTLLATFVHPKDQILELGVIHEGNAELLLTGNFTKWLGWGSIGLVISTFIGKATEDIWHGFSRSGTGDYAKIDFRFKQQRRKLLSYVGRKNNALKNFTKIGWVFAAFLIMISTDGTLLVFKKIGNIRHILGIYFFLGVIFVIMGLMFHAFVSDGNLMRAEKSYLIDRKDVSFDCMIHNHLPSPCGELGWEWHCYCQVFINLYCSRSPIFFENDVLHKAASTIVQIKELSDKHICSTRVLMDLVAYHNEQFPLYCGSEAAPERDYMETLFAGFVSDYLDYFGTKLPNELVDFTKDTMLLQVVKSMFDNYFRVQRGGYEYRSYVGVKNVQFDVMVNILKMDYIRCFCADRTTNVCPAYRWCEKNSYDDHHDFLRPFMAEIYRREFPPKIEELMKIRWDTANLTPCGGVKNLDEAFKKMHHNYNKNWIEEAKKCVVDDEDYWKQSIFTASEDA